MDKWQEFMQQAEALGEELNIDGDLDWEEIQEKRKKRKFLLWFDLNRLAVLGLILILFIVGLLLVLPSNDEPVSTAIAETSTSTQEILFNNKHQINTENLSRVVVPRNNVEDQAPITPIELHTSKELALSTSTGLSVNTEKQPSSNRIEIDQARYALEDKSIEKATAIQSHSVESTEITMDIRNNNHKSTYLISTVLPTLSKNADQPKQLPKAKESFYTSPSIDLLKPILLEATKELTIKTPPTRIIAKQPSNWNIGLRSAYSIPFRRLGGLEETEGPETTNTRRNKLETFLEAVDMQLQIQKNITNKLYVTSGITLSQYRSKFVDTYQLVQTNVAFDNQIKEVVIKNGVSTESIGTVYGSRTELHTNTKYQQYIAVSIPIQLGLQLPIKRTWSVKAASGFEYSLFHLNKGSVIASAISTGTYSSLNSLNYRTSGLLQSSSNIELVKSLPNNLDITLGVQMKYDLNSRITGMETIDKFRSFGASLGLMKRF